MKKHEIREELEDCYYDDNGKLFEDNYFDLDKAVDAIHKLYKNRWKNKFLKQYKNLVTFLTPKYIKKKQSNLNLKIYHELITNVFKEI